MDAFPPPTRMLLPCCAAFVSLFYYMTSLFLHGELAFHNDFADYEERKCFVGSEVLTAVVMKSFVLWDITQCSPLKVN
jgi:hypothetical protein